MNWKKWLTFDPYKKLWSIIGHRPWTFIYRDIWHRFEIFPQLQWFWTAVLIIWLLGGSIPLAFLLCGWGVYIFGYINGHFFWGKEYIPDQQGE